MSNDSALDITSIPEASLWAELVRRTQERERNGESSVWPHVSLSMAMGDDLNVVTVGREAAQG